MDLTTSDQEVADLFSENFKEVDTVEDLSSVPTVPEQDCTWKETICFSTELHRVRKKRPP